MEAPRIVFMGTPDFAATVLDYLIADDCQIVAVYTQQDKAAGRGRALATSAVKKRATELGIKVCQPRNFRDAENVRELRGLGAEIVVVAAYGQILPQVVLDLPRHGCLNIHPSLLPRFRGVSPVPAAILAGDEFTGVSVMLLDPGTDTGPILAQAQVSVCPEDTAGALSDKLARTGAQLMLEVLPAWTKKAIRPRPQDEGAASYCKKLKKEDGQIDWRLPAVEIWRRVRAFNPWPVAFTTLQGKQIKVLAAKAVAAVGPVVPGEVVEWHDKQAGFGIGTGDGILGIVTVQLQGKKPMPAGDFLRGQRGLIGQVVGRE